MRGGLAEIQVRGQRMVLAGAPDSYLRHLYTVDWDNHPLLALVSSVPAGEVYLDIGANIGATAIAAALMRPDLRVVAFEPVPSNFGFLSHNVVANGLRNCTAVPVAVGDICSHVGVTDAGPYSLVLLDHAAPSVPIVRLDDYWGKHLKGARVSVVKVDVEGYEPNVLAGAAELLRQFCPTIFMEFNSWTLLVQGYNPIAFARYLVEAFQIDPLPGVDTSDALSLAQENMIHHACVFDITMRPREQAPPVSLNALKLGVSPGELVAEALNRGLVEEVRALRASTSWRITAPLRAFKDMVSGRH
ncbi:MAG TPA: FkbM family methyltransferase [Acetobacteraceae bacterium]|nr:FkbM family methyltransferase [Acetobacteraceae bacterium]